MDLQNKILTFAVARPGLQRFVISKALQVVCIIWKRGWLEFDDSSKSAFLDQIKQLVGAGRAQQLLGARLTVALLSEFSSPRSSALGVSEEFHSRVRAAFQNGGALQTLFVTAVTTLLSAGGSAAADELTTACVTECLTAVGDALAWDFTLGSTAAAAAAAAKGSGSVREESGGGGSGRRSLPLVTPGEGWRQVLLQSNLCDSILTLYDSVQSRFHTNIPHLARQVLLQLASLSGAVFPSDAARTAFASSLLASALRLLARPLSSRPDVAAALASGALDAADVGDAEAVEVLSLCSLLLRLVSNFKLHVLCAVPDFPAFLQQLQALTLKLLTVAANGAAAEAAVASTLAAAVAAAGGTGIVKIPSAAAAAGEGSGSGGGDGDGAWALEGFDLLLDAWVLLVSHPLAKTGPMLSQLQPHCHAVYAALIDTRLQMATTALLSGVDEEDEFEDPEVLTEQMECASLLARVAAAASLPLLHHRLSACAQEYTRVLSAAAAAATGCMPQELCVLCEQMYWLTTFAGYLLADQPESEKPCIPNELHALSFSASAALKARHRAAGTATAAGDAAAADPIAACIHLLLQQLQQQASLLSAAASAAGGDASSGAALLSPLLCSQLLWCVRRLCCTYLMPDPSLYSYQQQPSTLPKGIGHGIAEAFGATAQGPHVLDSLVALCTVLLTLWATEPSVADGAIQLLRSLATDSRASQSLCATPSWATLLTAFLTSLQPQPQPSTAAATTTIAAPSTAALPPSLQGVLAEVLCRAAWAQTDAAASDGDAAMAAATQAAGQQFTAFAAPLQARLQALLAALSASAPAAPTAAAASSTLKRQSASARQQALLADVTRTMDLYRGIARATHSRCHALVAQFCLPALSPVVSVMGLYPDQPSVTLLGIQLFRDFAEAQMPVMAAQHCTQFYSACHALLTQYAAHHSEPVSAAAAATAAAAAAETESEAFADVTGLVTLLTHVISRDWFDFSDDPDTSPVAAAAAAAAAASAAAGGGGAVCTTAVGVVVYGVRVILPLMSADLLAFPQLCRKFYALLGFLFELYSEQMCALPPELFRALVSALEAGLAHFDTAVATSCLRALGELADWQFKATLQAAGGDAAATVAVGVVAQDGGQPTTMLHFLQLLFNHLISSTFADALLPDAASALLSLIACEQRRYPQLVHGVLAQFAGDEAAHARMAAAFTALTSDRGLQLSLNRRNRLIFRQNLRDFAAVARGMMRTR